MIEDTGAVCRCNVDRALEVIECVVEEPDEGCEDMERDVNRAVRSCEALATMYSCTSPFEFVVGSKTHVDVIGAE